MSIEGKRGFYVCGLWVTPSLWTLKGEMCWRDVDGRKKMEDLERDKYAVFWFRYLEGRDDHMVAKMMCDNVYLQNTLDAYCPH